MQFLSQILKKNMPFYVVLNTCMHRAEHCTDELYEIMCNCLQHEAKDRSSFEDILTKLVREDEPAP